MIQIGLGPVDRRVRWAAVPGFLLFHQQRVDPMSPRTVVPEVRSRTLRIRRSAWEPALRQLLARGQRFAMGSIRRAGAAGEQLLLVDELDVPLEVPHGNQRPPLDDWCVVGMLDGQTSSTKILYELQPLPSQLMVVLLLDRDNPSRFQLLALERGNLIKIDACEIIGQGMLTLRNEAVEPTSPQLRSSRTRGALGDEFYQRLQDMTVTVIGLGRTGSQVCFTLAGLGVGRLRLVDRDVLKIENLDAMPGLTTSDIGCSKAEALAARLYAFQPELSISYVEHRVTDAEAAPFLQRPCNLFVSTVDNDAARLAVSLLANRTLTPHLDIGTLVRHDERGTSLYDDIRLLLPGMCVACVGGLADPEAAIYELSAPNGSLQRGEPVDWSEQRSGSLLHLNSIACGMGLELWLRMLRGEIGAYWQRLSWEAGDALQLTGSQLAAVNECGLCSGR